MANDFLHGIEIKQIDVAQAATDVDLSVIGIIGTAPYADADKWPLNQPVLVAGADTTLISALAATAPESTDDIGTLPDAFASMLEETSPYVIAIRVEGTKSYDTATIPKIVGGIDADGNYLGAQGFLVAEARTGYRPRLLCAPGYTHQSSTKAIVGITITGAGKGYSPGSYSLSITDNAGVGAVATATVGGDGTVTNVDMVQNGSGYVGPTVQMPAEAGGSGAKFTAQVADSTNAVVAELKVIADRLRAVIFADGPNTTDADAITAAQQGGKRVMLIDPWIVRQVGDVQKTQPASAKFAARQAWTDPNEGFWRSISNHALNGVLALSRSIDFVPGEKASAANNLNAQNVSTIIRRPGVGFVTWGNRALDSSFLCVTRTVDDVNDALLNATLQFVDRGIDKNFVTEIVEFVNSYLRQLKARGAITGGRCWADASLNSPADVTQGHVTFDFDIGPVYPAERITFRSTINKDYVTTIFTGSDR